jgi:nucleoside-diphosphate-sugar epimerase
MTSWALTGATGFVGRALADAALARGARVRGLTRGTALAAGVETVRGDLADRAALAELVRGADVVVHLAAYVHRGGAGGGECHAVNVGGTEAVLEAVAAAASRPFLIFMSSANVYGPSDAPLIESSPCAPETVYGETKLEAERLVLDAVRRGAVRACVLRPAMIFGPGAPGNLRLLVKMVKCRVVFDAGDARKTLVPVQNVVSACFAVTERNGEVYNVGGVVLPMREITASIARSLDVRPLRVRLPKWLQPPIRLVRTYTSNAIVIDDKLRGLAGYDPVRDVVAELEAAIRA